MIDQMRVSMGTLRVLGLELLATGADPTTAYLQTYHPGKCVSNCRFCAQARESSAREEKIARGLYPPRDTGEIVSRLAKAYDHGLLKRACVQTMNYQGMFDDLMHLIEDIRGRSRIPISVSIYPFPQRRFERLKEAGASKLVIPLDAATEKIFDGIKGLGAGCPYTWENHMRALDEAVEVFGRGNVGTHLIVGFGESEEDAVKLIQKLSGMGVYCALFAFTPVPFAQLQGEPPDIGGYRRIQLACHLIESGESSLERMSFDAGRITGFGVPQKVLDSVIDSGEPFVTRGCPDCNRPYSTESPGGVIYNFPRKPGLEDLKTIKKQIDLR